jgi:endo-1,4-beta-xylanase
MARGAGCLNWASPDLWGAEVGNCPGLPDRGGGGSVSTPRSSNQDVRIYRNGLPPDVADAQARFYGRIFRVVLKHPAVVTRVTLWNTHDGASWLNFYPVAFRTNHPLLRDRALKPKPALGAVLDALATP